MKTLPNLEELSLAEKDDLIRFQFSQVIALTEQVEAQMLQIGILTAKVAELEGRLALNSSNSSKPPSMDGFNKPKPKSLRLKGQNSTGGQKGHKGSTLKKVECPDHIENHTPPSHCDICNHAIPDGVVVESRQVFDIPAIRHVVTEHRVLESRCACGKVHRGKFPEGVSAPVQYGSNIKAAVVELTHHHMMPVARTGDLTGDLFGLPLSDATILAINEEAREILVPTVAAIGEAVKNAPVGHADETGMYVSGTLYWLHVLATPMLTWMGSHANRGKIAFDAFGLLTAFTGTLVHDGWISYRDLACLHALCNAHHLRELTFVFEEMKQAWAKRLIDLMIQAHQEVALVGGPLAADRIAYYRSAHVEILSEGAAVNPRAPPSGKRGKTKQSKALNLHDRLRDHADDVWRFLTDPNVPFSNNIAEQIMRMNKVKQKISGGFRTEAGLASFCTIRSYLATMQKQGFNIFDSLKLAFQGTPPQPRFA